MEEEENQVDARKFFKQGQKFVTPIHGDATRGFYETLLEENPKSKIALKFCVENGIFTEKKHLELLEKYLELKNAGEFNAAKKKLQKRIDEKKMKNRG